MKNRDDAALTQPINVTIDLNGKWEFFASDSQEKYPAHVPGCVHLDLMENDLIPDPYYRDNEQKVQWIGERNWHYVKSFTIDNSVLKDSNFFLVCEGLDTFAEIFINHKKVTATENMFRKYEFPIQRFLKNGSNQIEIRFLSPTRKVQQDFPDNARILPSPNESGKPTAPYVRKAPYHFGWDWGPRLITMGIWRSIYLENRNSAKLGDFRIQQRFQKADGKIVEAELNMTVIILRYIEQIDRLSCRLYIKQNDEIIFSETSGVDQSAQQIEFSATIKNPKLWFPNGYGEQPLYTMIIELTSAEHVIDVLEKRIGLRELALQQEDDPWGRSFQFMVNGVPIFIKGANWIPGDVFLPRMTERQYEHLLTSSAQAHMNMLRVWGGGIYEDDIFYDLCDEKGILVWQDFMFACALYPANDSFLANVHAEIRQAILRLRHHPCLALWCGNNEIEWAWFSWGWEETFPPQLFKDYLKLFYEEIPALVKTYDPDREYWPSSPAGTDRSDANDQQTGDMHCWEVWHGQKPFSYYKKIRPRFLSEFGFQSFPLMSYIEKFTQPKDRNLAHPVMANHQKCANGNGIIDQYLSDQYRIPRDFTTFVWLSQLLQAEAMKTAVEHIRSIKPCCMGSLYWQLNDCWPAVSWSSIDYQGTWKALHYYATRFYAPLLIYPHFQGAQIALHIISDMTDPINLSCHWQIMNVNGKILSADTISAVQVLPLSAKSITRIDMGEIKKLSPLKECFFYCWAEDNMQEIISSNVLHFHPLKQIDLPRADIEINWGEDDEKYIISLKSPVLVKHLYLEITGRSALFSDNFFDLIPNVVKKISLPKLEGMPLSELEEKLSIMHLGLY